MKAEKSDRSDGLEEDGSSGSTLLDPTLVSVIDLANEQRRRKVQKRLWPKVRARRSCLPIQKLSSHLPTVS